MKKLFIGHASEDKDAFVRGLAEALKKDFDVWFDEDKLVIGCSLLEEISKGIAECDYGVVILSPNFFEKKWTNDELRGLFALEEKDRKVILPIWKDVDVKDVVKHYPILADRKAAMAKEGIDKVVSDIKLAIAYFEKGRSAERPAEGFSKFRTILQKREEKRRSDEIVSSSDGVHLATKASQSAIKYYMDQLKELSEEGGIGPMKIDGPHYNDYHSQATVFIGKLYLHAEYNNTVSNSARLARLTMLIGEQNRGSFSDVERQEYAIFVTLEKDLYWQSENEKDLLSPEELVDKWLAKFAKILEREDSS